jgi:hypothetical protein
VKLATPSEHKIQASLINYLNINARPEIFYFAIPNGGLRNIRVAQMMKAEGLKAGVADLCFMLPEGRCAWLELKTSRGQLRDQQHGFKTRCRELGHFWAMARSIDEALPHLAAWNVLKRVPANLAVPA